MSSELKHRRGTAAAHANFTGAQGEITIKTDTNEIVVHDGVTPGGWTGGGYQPAGTGAVTRTVQDKLREFVSVKDFGAKGDGVTDDTAAIQAAVTYATSSGKLLFAPSGNYLISGTGLAFPAQFPGLIGEGIFRTVFYYTGTGTAITLGGYGPLGVYRDWQVKAGAPGESEATARSVARNGIYWKCYGGQGEISNVKATYFNGFGQKFEAIWDSCVNNVITESCGNSSEYAFSVVNGTDTSNHTNFNRVQVELSYTKAFYFEGLNNVLIGLHSERTTGDGVNYTHVLRGDITVINSRIEASSNVYAQVGIAFGSMQDSKFFGNVDFSWGSRLNNYAEINGCFFAGNVRILSSNLRHYHFKDCHIAGNFASSYQEKDTRFTTSKIDGNITLTNNNTKLILDKTTTSGTIVSGGGNNYFEAYNSSLAYFPSIAFTTLEGGSVTNAVNTVYYQRCVVRNVTFHGLVTITNSNAIWRSLGGNTYAAGVAYGAGTAGWIFSATDRVTGGSVSAALLSPAPGSIGEGFYVGERHYRLIPAVGQPKSWVCTVAGAAATWVSEGNL